MKEIALIVYLQYGNALSDVQDIIILMLYLTDFVSSNVTQVRTVVDHCDFALSVPRVQWRKSHFCKVIWYHSRNFDFRIQAMLPKGTVRKNIYFVGALFQRNENLRLIFLHLLHHVRFDVQLQMFLFRK